MTGTKKIISRFHYITQDVPGYTHSQLAEFACRGGAKWVQLRVKNRPADVFRNEAKVCKIICEKYGARLIINDNVYLAKEISADGVHLGKEDMNAAEAREFLGNDFIIGGSSNSFEDIQRNANDGCDYVGLGPFRFTSTRDNLNPILGPVGIKNIMGQCARKKNGIPVIAIGGIAPGDVKLLMDAGVFGIAVSSAINLSENKTETTMAFLGEINPA